jgi:putative oxidoreductase
MYDAAGSTVIAVSIMRSVSRMAIPIRRDTPRSEPIVVREQFRHPTPRQRLWSHAPNVTLAALRIVAGLMFVQHGVQKLFGLLPMPDAPAFTDAPPMFSQMWFAGSLELVGGVMLALGLFTRIVAFIISGEMAVAYFMVHAPRGFFPVQNGGELAALYCFVFLAFAAIGGGAYSIDRLIDRLRAPALSPSP